MIQHVYERALSSGADQIIIATDDHRIAETAGSFSAEICITASITAAVQSVLRKLSEVCLEWRYYRSQSAG